MAVLGTLSVLQMATRAATKLDPNDGHSVRINTLSGGRGFEVGRRYFKGKQKAGTMVDTWEEAVALRTEMEVRQAELAQRKRQISADSRLKKVSPPSHCAV